MRTQEHSTVMFALAGTLCLAGQVVADNNLARLSEQTPGASTTLAWSAGGKEIGVPALADGDRERPVEVPTPCETIGVAWPIAHVIDGVEVFFDGPPAKANRPALEAFDGMTWVPIRERLEVEAPAGRKSLRFSFEPIACPRIRLRLTSDSHAPCEFEVQQYVPPMHEGRITWPEKMVTRRFAEEMLAREAEPSFEALSLHGLPMPIWATMGLKDRSDEQAVSWDGRIFTGTYELSCRVGDSPQTFADVRDTVRRTLLDGYLPAVVTEGQFGCVHLRQVALVTFTDDERKEPALFVRYELKNISDRECKTQLEIRLALRDAKARAEYESGALKVGAAVYLTCQGENRPGRSQDAIACDVDLAPGQTRAMDFAARLGVPEPGSAAATPVLAKTGFANAAKRFRAYWNQLLTPTMKLALPEPRLNNLYKSVLTQLLINADGNVMPYGSMPSAYEGKLYGVEEAYAMAALAVSGLTDDAQRYMDGTYLTDAFLRKVEKHTGYADRHQQYRNGLQPTYAVELYRLTRDKTWIRKHVGLLKDCAEWTFANRRKTMVEESGKRPLHWGLLPKWSYGGDLSRQQCYPLYANYACWRGLHDTAWLMGELGDETTAKRYRAEADAYYKRIMEVIDAIYRADADPPFLPPHVYTKEPEGGEYYQLFAGLSLDLLPFAFDDKRANYLGDYLEQSNRTFCLLPRFRRDAGPGGLDAIYGLGHMLTRLHQDRTREYLLGFYAYLVFNMEHTCFSSRETNAIYASDLHLRTRFEVPEKSDPVPCSSAVPLLLLRHMLVTEEQRGAGTYTGALRLLPAAPRRWFGHGKTIRVLDAPTHFGKVSFEVTSKTDEGAIEAVVTAPGLDACKAVKLRLRHPAGSKFKAVTVNGNGHQQIDPAAELIVLPDPSGTYRIRAEY